MRGTGSLHVITGCMFSGKTEELVRLLRRASVGGRSVLLIRPQADTRSPAHMAESRSGARYECQSVPTAADIMGAVLADPVEIVAIDEIEFFGGEVAEVANRLATDGYEVIVSGLDTDFAGRPFGALPALLALADSVTKLTAVCTFPGCGEDATRTQRLVNNEPAAIDDPLIVIGGTEDAREPDRYEARCRTHHRVAPPRHSEASDAKPSTTEDTPASRVSSSDAPSADAPSPDAPSNGATNGNGAGDGHALETDVFDLSELPAPSA